MLISVSVPPFYDYHIDSFFFSSRRRHTRWPRDWSSDVCSSDLSKVWIDLLLEIARQEAETLSGLDGWSCEDDPLRSEERRVGKECRCRWSDEDRTAREKSKRRERRGSRKISGASVKL